MKEACDEEVICHHGDSCSFSKQCASDALGACQIRICLRTHATSVAYFADRDTATWRAERCR
jgi:hypothetical protein